MMMETKRTNTNLKIRKCSDFIIVKIVLIIKIRKIKTMIPKIIKMGLKSSENIFLIKSINKNLYKNNPIDYKLM